MNKDLLLTLLGEERPIDERIEALASVRDLLGDRDLVLALASMAATEKSAKMRRALLDVVLGCQDATPPLVEFLYTVVIREPEEELRLAAVRRLAQIGGAEDLLIECLQHDLSESIQAECLKGLKNGDGLHEYAATAPPSLKPALMALFKRDAAGLLRLLDAADPAEFKHALLEKLSTFPSLPPQGLVHYLHQESSRELRLKTLGILMERTEVDPELALSEPELLKNRLDSYPHLVGKLAALLRTTPSSRLKLVLLNQLDQLELYIWALSDPSPAVRRVAIEGCLKRKHREEVPRALLAAIPNEPLVSLRELMIPAVQDETFLIEWCGRETDPRLEQALASAVVTVAVTDEHRAALLRIYLKILREPFYDVEIKGAVLEKLTSYAHRNEPELRQALIDMLERAQDLDTVERVDKLVRLVEPDPRKLADVRLKVFYRFVGRYPIDPLVEWLREFRSLAAEVPAIRRQIAYLAAITEATWVLDAAESSAKANVSALFMECIRKGSHRDAGELLQEAYQNRTLKKSDLLGLFNTLITYHLSPHNSYPMLDSVLKIMSEVKLVTPELVDRCFTTMRIFPHGMAEYMLRKYLEETGPHEDRLRAEFTAENYRKYCLRDFDARDTTRLPHSWTDSDHWRVWHPQWTVGEMVCQTLKGWRSLACEHLEQPVDPNIPCQQSFHYYLLYQLWRTPQPSIEERAAIGRFMRSVKPVKGYEQVFDRALFLFCDRWSEISDSMTPEAAELAAEAFVEQVRRYRANPVRQPQPLKGMNVDHLRRIWSWSDSDWQKLWDTYREYLSGDRSGSGSDRAPLFYFPIENAASSIVEFLIGTPQRSHAAVWRDLLKTAQSKNARLVEYRLERASPERRAELQALTRE